MHTRCDVKIAPLKKYNNPNLPLQPERLYSNIIYSAVVCNFSSFFSHEPFLLLSADVTPKQCFFLNLNIATYSDPS